MVLNPCNGGVACHVTIFKRILAKQVGEYSLVGKLPVFGIERTLCMDSQRSCPKDMKEMAKYCFSVFLEHKGA